MLLAILTCFAVVAIAQRTPTMGWSSWNTFALNINEDLIKGQAVAMHQNGLQKAGYLYVNIDDGYWDGRGEDGHLRLNTKLFPNGMRPLVDYIHQLGLKAGIYSDAGDNTCGSQNRHPWGVGVGFAGHEEQDCKLYFIDWDFDFIKVDYCGGNHLRLDEREQYTKISNAIKTFMPLIVLAVAALALFAPGTCLWVETGWINPLLMVVLFGMGLTMNVSDFAAVFQHPKDCLIGVVGQYVVMPLSAFAIGTALGLEPALMAGLVLVGTCPGGTASDVMTYLGRGDVALSVSVTAVNTALAPFLTPIITLLLLQTTVSVDVVAMFISILQVAIIPIALGLVVNHFFPQLMEAASDVLPLISVVAICLIVAAVVSHNSEQIFTTRPLSGV